MQLPEIAPLLLIERVKAEEKYLLSVFCESLFAKGYKNGQLKIVTGFVF